MSRITEQVTAADSASAAANLFELSEVCEVERAKLCPAPEQETAGLMKPPTLVRPPSAPRPVTKEAGVSVSTVPPDPAPSFNPRPERPVLN